MFCKQEVLSRERQALGGGGVRPVFLWTGGKGGGGGKACLSLDRW